MTCFLSYERRYERVSMGTNSRVSDIKTTAVTQFDPLNIKKAQFSLKLLLFKANLRHWAFISQVVDSISYRTGSRANWKQTLGSEDSHFDGWPCFYNGGRFWLAEIALGSLDPGYCQITSNMDKATLNTFMQHTHTRTRKHTRTHTQCTHIHSHPHPKKENSK